MSPSEMEKEEEAGATDHHSMFHLWEYKNPLAAIFVFTLVLGAPLSVNKWWHLRVSSNRSGRGVIKLIQGISKRLFPGCVCLPHAGKEMQFHHKFTLPGKSILEIHCTDLSLHEPAQRPGHFV